MDWSDEGIFLSAKPLGEANAIAELFTAGHGRHLGLVRGGRSRRIRPLLQPGNILSVTWRARLADHLGGFNVELIDPRAARVLDDEAALSAIGSLTSLAKHLPERDPHPDLYRDTLVVLQALDVPQAWPAALVRWEMTLLQDLGFGLDLSECAATGTDADLSYVSPKSGRAVAREAGEPYRDWLLKLPRFLLEEDQTASPQATCSPASRSPAISSSATFSPPTALPSPAIACLCCWRGGHHRSLRRLGRCAKRELWERGFRHPSSQGPIEPVEFARGAGRALPRLRALHHHAPGAARRARRTEAGASAAALRHAAAQADPQGEFRKCAKIVGDTMGNFHPHGNQAIYDALARLAQDFSVRYPLIDGQGNFGNIDGDNPAADRYTEARLTEIAAAAPRRHRRGHGRLPPQLRWARARAVGAAGKFPNLLANGSSGIAVGMATNIPPHNAGELCDAALHLIKFPNATADKLVDFVPGPDFPTGGIIVEPRERSSQAYKTGRGSFRLRARWAARRHRPRHLSDRGHRDSLPGPQGAAGCAASPSCCCRRSCRCLPTCATNWRKTCGWCSSLRAAASIRSC